MFPRILAENQTSKQVKIVDLNSAFVEPLSYPLLFPQGTLGYGLDDKYCPSVNGTFTRILWIRYFSLI